MLFLSKLFPKANPCVQVSENISEEIIAQWHGGHMEQCFRLAFPIQQLRI